MNEFKIIIVMNESMLKLLKDKNADYSVNLKIRKKLEDEALFFKINQTEAFEILKNVGVKQKNIENVYKKLISPDEFYTLLNNGKISINEKDLIIKYDTYNSDDLFKRKKNGEF